LSVVLAYIKERIDSFTATCHCNYNTCTEFSSCCTDCPSDCLL